MARARREIEQGVQDTTGALSGAVGKNAALTSPDPEPALKETGSDLKHIEDAEEGSKFQCYREAGLAEDDARFMSTFTDAEETAIYRKVDFRVVPLLSLLYLISHLDRANIGLCIRLPRGVAIPASLHGSSQAMPRLRVSRKA